MTGPGKPSAGPAGQPVSDPEPARPTRRIAVRLAAGRARGREVCRRLLGVAGSERSGAPDTGRTSWVDQAVSARTPGQSPRPRPHADVHVRAPRGRRGPRLAGRCVHADCSGWALVKAVRVARPAISRRARGATEDGVSTSSRAGGRRVRHPARRDLAEARGETARNTDRAEGRQREPPRAALRTAGGAELLLGLQEFFTHQRTTNFFCWLTAAGRLKPRGTPSAAAAQGRRAAPRPSTAPQVRQRVHPGQVCAYSCSIRPSLARENDMGLSISREAGRRRRLGRLDLA